MISIELRFLDQHEGRPRGINVNARLIGDERAPRRTVTIHADGSSLPLNLPPADARLLGQQLLAAADSADLLK